MIKIIFIFQVLAELCEVRSKDSERPFCTLVSTLCSYLFGFNFS